MTKTGNTDERLAALEKRVSREKTAMAIEVGTRVASAGVAAGAFYRYLGGPVHDFGQFCGEVVDGARTAKALASLGTADVNTQHYLGLIPKDLACAYEECSGDYLAAGRIGLESAQKASENFPGAKTEVVQSVRGLKGKIIETTKGWIRGNPEEARQTNTPEYQINYNDLVALRVAGVKKMKTLEGHINVHCEKMAVNEARTGQVDQEGVKILEGLVKQHNDIASLINTSENLGVQPVAQGINNTQYQVVLTTANSYGLQPIDYSDYGTAALLSGTLLAAYLGNRVGKFAVRAPIAAYKIGTKLVDVSSGSVRSIRKGVSTVVEKIRSRKA